MPRVTVDCCVRWQFDFREYAKSLVIQSSVIGPHLNKMLQFSQLMYSDRRCDVGEIVFESAGCDFVVPIPLVAIPVPRIFADAVETKNLHLIVKLRTVSNDHAPLASRHIFRRVETEAHCITCVTSRGATAADGIASVVCPDGVCRIFNNV